MSTLEHYKDRLRIFAAGSTLVDIQDKMASSGLDNVHSFLGAFDALFAAGELLTMTSENGAKLYVHYAHPLAKHAERPELQSVKRRKTRH